jgi:hypothetical protein
MFKTPLYLFAYQRSKNGMAVEPCSNSVVQIRIENRTDENQNRNIGLFGEAAPRSSSGDCSASLQKRD